MRWQLQLLTVATLTLSASACQPEQLLPVGPSVSMRFDGSSFYDAPWPSDHRLRDDGTVDLTGFASSALFVEGLLEVLDGQARGFGSSSGVFFTLGAAIDPQSLPSLQQSLDQDAGLLLLSVDPAAPDYLQRYPFTSRFQVDAGPFGAANLLSLVPLQGVPLRPSTRYAAVVTRQLRSVLGAPLSPSASMAALVRGEQSVGLSDAALAHYQEALGALAEHGVANEEVVGLAVFTTWDPTAELSLLTSHARGLVTPAPLIAFERTDLFDDYCVYQSRLEMPVYQQGEPPYLEGGGGIVIDPNAGPAVDHLEQARLVITIPRQTMPAGGWPTTVMIRTGGGGDRPLVDRGPRAEAGGQAITAGTGSALHFARAKFAGVSVDGPHGGIRNVSKGDEQFLIFNISNPTAMRDNLRQSALELALLPDVLAALALDISDCPGSDAPSQLASFATDKMGLMGHSMGATIAPLTLAVEPRYQAVILSGAGGSWIENVVHKKSPLAVRPLAEVLLGYPSKGYSLHEHDPALSLLQWAGEPADPPPYAARYLSGDGAPHVLMLQGIVDTYILPPIANATSLSFRLDLGGTALDADHAELSEFRPLQEVLEYSGGQQLELPVSGNRGATTAVVVQHAEDGIEDGHEVMFQSEGPKHQYRCFLDSWRSGTPIVVVAELENSACTQD